MIWQLHWQFKDDHTEARAQREINSESEMREFVRETQSAHPLPSGAVWLMCNEKSGYFVPDFAPGTE
jgi:hypothetical protein